MCQKHQPYRSFRLKMFGCRFGTSLLSKSWYVEPLAVGSQVSANAKGVGHICRTRRKVCTVVPFRHCCFSQSGLVFRSRANPVAVRPNRHWLGCNLKSWKRAFLSCPTRAELRVEKDNAAGNVVGILDSLDDCSFFLLRHWC